MSSISTDTSLSARGRLHCEGSTYLCEAQWGLNAQQEADRPQALLPWLAGRDSPASTGPRRHLRVKTSFLVQFEVQEQGL